MSPFLDKVVDDLVRGARRRDLLRWTMGNFGLILLMTGHFQRTMALSTARAWLESLPGFGVPTPAYLRGVNEAVHTAMDERLKCSPGPKGFLSPAERDPENHKLDALRYLTGGFVKTSMARRAQGLGV